MHGILCSNRAYHFHGWTFENHAYLGPWPLKKNGDPRERMGRRFLKIYAEFDKLTSAEQEEYRVGGGCQTI